MKILLDEHLPHELRFYIVDHETFTVRYMRWNGLRNGKLLAQAAADDFDAILTMDAGIAQQQNLASLPLAVVILHAKSNAIIDLLPLVPQLVAALNHLKPNAITEIT
jgi:hypothetical protein